MKTVINGEVENNNNEDKKVIIVAIYLCGADVAARLSLLSSPSRFFQIKFSLKTYCRYVRALLALPHKHCLWLIRWLAATARHSSKQLAADARERPTITPLVPPPATLSASSARYKLLSLSGERVGIATRLPLAFQLSSPKTHHPVLSSFRHIFTHLHKVSSRNLCTHQRPRSGGLIDSLDKKRGDWCISKVTDVTALQFSKRRRPN